MSTYPTLASGAISQRPYSREGSFLHTTNEMASGPRFSYSYRDSPLHCFTLTYSSITDADLATLEAFFVSMNGRYGIFEYTDLYDATTYDTCRFDQDQLAVKYNQKNSNSITVKICEVGYS